MLLQLRSSFAVAHLRSVFRLRGRGKPNGPPKGGSTLEGATMARATALPIISAESGLSRYLEEIRRFPMLEPQEEYMLALSLIHI